MKATGAEHAVRALEDEGVGLAFGIPGTHTIEVFDALRRSDRVTPVLVADERGAAFMADGAWRASGRLAALTIVPGAGLTHALSGVAEAYLDQAPMVVLAAGIRTDTGHAYQLHAIDQVALAAPVTKAQLRVGPGDGVAATVRRACRLALTPPCGPVFVEVPVERLLFRGDEPAGDGAAAPAPAHGPPPAAGDLTRARALLAASRRPLLYLGQGALAAGADLVTLAERLEAPVATTFSGKGVVPEAHPLWLWPGLGAIAPPFAREVEAGRDLLLAIGCRFGEVATGSYGLTPPGPLVHVDVDPAVLGRNLPAALGVVADAGAFVRALLEDLPARPRDEALRATLARGHAALRAEAAAAPVTPGRVAPAALLEALQAELGPEAAYVTDSGNGTFLAVEGLRLARPRSFLAPTDFSCMGYAVPAAVGAALACPGRPVAALAGDGAFLMTGLELLTARQAGAGVVVCVLRDRALAQIAQLQERVLARRACTDLPDYDLAALGRALDVECLALDDGGQARAVLARAHAAAREGRPVLVDVAIDYARPTFFTRGVVATNWGRLGWGDRLRMAGRVAARRLGLAT